MQNLMPILLVLILVISYCALGKSNTKSRSNNSSNENNNLVVCLLLVGIVIFFVMFDMNKKEEEFLNSQPRPYPTSPLGKNQTTFNNNSKCIKNYEKYPLLGGVYHSDLQSNGNVNGNQYNKSTYNDDLINLNLDPAGNYPAVDYGSNAPKSMFLLAHNQSSFDCCPSTYSDSRGCVCQTDSQAKYVRNSGM